MSKTLVITVTDSENPENPQELEVQYTDDHPTEEQWVEEILPFLDDHVGGRPKDR